MDQKQSIASLAASLGNLELVSRNIQSDIQAITAPVQRILQQGEDTRTGLSELQAQTHQTHEVTLDLYRNIPERFRLLLHQDRTSSHSSEQTLITNLGQFGTELELLRSEIKTSDQKREGEAEALAMRMGVLVRILQGQGPRLIAK